MIPLAKAIYQTHELDQIKKFWHDKRNRLKQSEWKKIALNTADKKLVHI